MKAFTFVAALFLLSSPAFSIGRPHNIFATHQAVVAHVESQPRIETITQKSVLNDVSERAERSVTETRRVVSMVEKIVAFFLRIFQ